MQQLLVPYFKVSQLDFDQPNYNRGHSPFTLWIRLLNLACIRILDLTLVLLAAPILLPLCVLIAIAIKWDSLGPVFFIQERVGARCKRKGNRLIWEITPFHILKFRSMVHNADPSLHQEHIKHYVQGTLAAASEKNASVKLVSDPRITRVGHFLRKTSLDELPQLVNVLRGEMSLVGPRPVPLYEVAEYQEWHYARLAAYPGLTGLWQLDGRGQVSFEEMVRMDIDYVQRQSLWLNLKILALTPFAVLSGRGAA